MKPCTETGLMHCRGSFKHHYISICYLEPIKPHNEIIYMNYARPTLCIVEVVSNTIHFLVDYLGNINMKYSIEISLTNSLLDYKFHIIFFRTLFIQNTVILSHPITRKSTRIIDLMLLLLEKKSICVSALPFVRWTGLSAARPASANPTRQPRTAKSPAPRRPHTRRR